MMPHYANLRDGELMRIARRVTLADVADALMFVLVAAVVLMVVL